MCPISRSNSYASMVDFGHVFANRNSCRFFFPCRYMSFPDDEKILLRSYLQEWYQQVSVSEESFYRTVFDANKTMCISYIFISESISRIYARKFFDLEYFLAVLVQICKFELNYKVFKKWALNSELKHCSYSTI